MNGTIFYNTESSKQPANVWAFKQQKYARKKNMYWNFIFEALIKYQIKTWMHQISKEFLCVVVVVVWIFHKILKEMKELWIHDEIKI